jgi:hypothetical protein
MAAGGQDAGKATGAKPYAPKVPKGWTKLLKLSKDQQAKIREIDRKRHKDEEPLLKQLADLRAKARKDMLNAPSEAQRKTLLESILGKEETAPAKVKKE